MQVLNDKELYYTRAFRRRDPNGTLQAKVEKLLAAQVVSSFEGKRGQEDFHLGELALAVIVTVIDQIASWGKIFYHGPMLEAVRQALRYLIIWNKPRASQESPSKEEADQAGAAIFMLVLWKLFPEYVIDHPQSPITTLVEIVTDSEYAPDVSKLITDEPCTLFVKGEIFQIYHVPCTVFGEREENLLKEARARGDITNFHTIDVSDEM